MYAGRTAVADGRSPGLTRPACASGLSHIYSYYQGTRAPGAAGDLGPGPIIFDSRALCPGLGFFFEGRMSLVFFPKVKPQK